MKIVVNAAPGQLALYRLLADAEDEIVAGVKKTRDFGLLSDQGVSGVLQEGRTAEYKLLAEAVRETMRRHNIPADVLTVVIGPAAQAKAFADVFADVKACSPNGEPGCLSLEDLYLLDEPVVLVNLTAIGALPDQDRAPADISRMHKPAGVVDCVAHPYRTRLQFEAKCAGLPYCGGLAVETTIAAKELRLAKGKDFSADRLLQAEQDAVRESRNIVIIGMPTSGKTTLSALLSGISTRPVIEMDEMIEKKLGMSIARCFAEKGEEYFRDAETQTAKDLRGLSGCIISCGGGVIKRRENMRYLSENGLIILIDRNLEKLFPSDERPLSSSRQAIRKLYEEREPLYRLYHDLTVDNNTDPESAAAALKKLSGI